MAYAGLAVSLRNLGQPSLALEYATKAYQLRDRVSEREKLRISADYFRATGELEKEAQTYELWTANYPRDSVPHVNLGANYIYHGAVRKSSCGISRRPCGLSRTMSLSYGNLGETYLYLNRLDEAKATFDQAFAHKLDGGFLRSIMYYLAFLRGDAAQMEQQVAWAAGKPGDEDLLLSAQSDTEAYYGRLSKARDFSRRAVDSAVRADSKETAALWQVNAALREAELGNIASAKQGSHGGVGAVSGAGCEGGGSPHAGSHRRCSRAKALAEELEKNYPTNTILKLYWLPTINAAIELSKGIRPKRLCIWKPPRPTNWAVTMRTLGTCTPPICAAKPTCWHTMEQPQPPSSRNCWITGASW